MKKLVIFDLDGTLLNTMILALDLINHIQLIKDYTVPCLFPLYDCQDSIAFLIFWVSLSLKAPLWEYCSVKLFRLDLFVKLPQPFIFHLEQLLVSRLSCHE